MLTADDNPARGQFRQVQFENSASESTAAAMLAAPVHHPLRGTITFKSPVGTNVASDTAAWGPSSQNIAFVHLTSDAHYIVVQ
jgi:TPP-dependent indolepyruvate ferredoxin oxidoreductase alpha subunit